MCEAFGCPPDVALQQDWQMVKAILEYRVAESAKAQHNQDATKMSEAQVQVWATMTKAMIEAQNG